MLLCQIVCKIKSDNYCSSVRQCARSNPVLSVSRSAGVQHQARHYVLLDQDNVKDQVWNLALLDPEVCKIKSGKKC